MKFKNLVVYLVVIAWLVALTVQNEVVKSNCSYLSESEVAQSCLTLCDPMDTRPFCPWDFLGKKEYWSGLPFPSPGNFPTQESNPGLPHCRQMLYRLSHQLSNHLLIL